MLFYTAYLNGIDWSKVYNVASSILGDNCSADGSLIKNRLYIKVNIFFIRAPKFYERIV
jgi:hypothetical protein